MDSTPHPRTDVLISDDWGSALAERLVGSGLIAAEWVVSETGAGSARPCLAFAATESVSAFRRIDDHAFAGDVPWSAVVLTPTGVRLGPVIVPGKSACYECFLRRMTQHDPYAWRTATIWSAAESCPIDGWLPADLLVAEGFAAGLLTGDPTRDWPAGSVTSYQAITAHVSRATVIGRHGCDRCRPARDRAEDTWRDLAAEFYGIAGETR